MYRRTLTKLERIARQAARQIPPEDVATMLSRNLQEAATATPEEIEAAEVAAFEEQPKLHLTHWLAEIGASDNEIAQTIRAVLRHARPGERDLITVAQRLARADIAAERATQRRHSAVRRVVRRCTARVRRAPRRRRSVRRAGAARTASSSDGSSSGEPPQHPHHHHHHHHHLAVEVCS